ncbi:MAG: hypothetical protein LBR34_00335 [Prevotella sp.]|jgi:hypothetical protein|nr:hypothetical protein [Prevotella sp.]
MDLIDIIISFAKAGNENRLLLKTNRREKYFKQQHFFEEKYENRLQIIRVIFC